MDRKEALNLFIRSNLKLLLSRDFPVSIFKRAKLDFFLDRQSKHIGVPRDKEIAEHATMFLIRNGVLSDEEELSTVLSLPFFAKNIINKEPIRERLRLQQSTITAVDVRKLSESKVRDRVRAELKEEILRESIGEIQQAIKRKKEEYLLIPSILDSMDFEEPKPPEPPPVLEGRFVPWWKRLGLVSDPFPEQEGLAAISKDLYESVVYKTPIFEKHVYLIKESPGDLYKNTIFFGEFGSGKTTLFDYLRKPLINERIFNIYIQLYAEQDLQTLLNKFRKKLYEGLCDIFDLLYDSDPRDWLKSTTFQDGILELLRRIVAKADLKGLIVFIDDLHKDSDQFEIAMKFINNLQILRAELIRGIEGLNIAFLIAGSSYWRGILENDPKYSGSYAKYEIMPPVTAETAYEMLNMRLSTFAGNPEAIRTIDLGYVKRIYRGLQNNKLPITFRSFIKATLLEFDKGNFTILTADPIHIPVERLTKIRNILESDRILRRRISNLLFGGGIQNRENREKTLNLLVRTYLEGGIADRTTILQKNKFSFQRLARSGLIRKAKFPDGLRWVICPELDRQNRLIVKGHNLSLEDYLVKAYISPLPKKAKKKIRKILSELKLSDSIIHSLNNKEAKKLMKFSRDGHEVIIRQTEKFSSDKQPSELVLDCISNLALLTRAIATFLGLPTAPKKDISFLRNFWRDFWYSPGEISEFINQASKHEDVNTKIWYVCLLYREAYGVLTNFFAEEIDKSRYFMIPLSDLKNEEITQFQGIRKSWARNAYFDVAESVTELFEHKIKTFLFNILTLLYGDRQARLGRVDSTTRKYIEENMKKDKMKDFNIPKNEFEQLNRGNFKNFIIGSYGSEIGRRNWNQIFKHVFAPLNEDDLKVFLSNFAEINIAISHRKTKAISANQQTLILKYLLRSFDIMKKMNRAYRVLVEKCLYIEGSKGSRGFLLSFNKLADRNELTQIRVSQNNATRVVGILSRKKPSFSVDLEDRQFVESYFNISYREFMATLARLIGQTPLETQRSGLSVRITRTKGSLVTLRVVKVDGKPIAGE